MNLTGIYLYGFVPPADELDLSGIEGIDSAGPILALNLGATTAVIGQVQVEAFEAALSSGADGGPDPSWVIPRALKHEAILEAVQARSPVLPARFGTLFSSSSALEGMASEHQSAIARFFTDLGDRLEWSLRGYYNPDQAADLLINGDPEFSRRWQALPESPGTRYFREKKLREEARLAARQTAARTAETVRVMLRTLTDDVRSLPLRGREAPGREMILHETFLLPRKLASEALGLLKGNSVEPIDGLMTWVPSGPWPPFHFCPDLGGPES